MREYHYLGQWRTPLMYGWLLQNWSHNSIGVPLGLPPLSGNLLHLDGHLFLNQADWNALVVATETSVDREDYKLFRGLAEVFRQTTTNLLEVSEKIAATENPTSEDWHDFFDRMNEMEYPWHAVLPVSEVLERKIRESLSIYNLPEETLGEFFGPGRPTLFKELQDAVNAFHARLTANEILKSSLQKGAGEALTAIKQNDLQLYNDILAHLQKFGWFGTMHMWGDPYTKEVLFEQLRAVTEKTPQLTHAALPEPLRKLKEEVRELTYWRNYVAEACAVGGYTVLPKLKLAAESLGVTDLDLQWFTPLEFLQSLRDAASPDEAVRKTREAAFGTYVQDGEVILITGEELQKMLARHLPSLSSNKKELRGSTAQNGKATGRACILLSPKDMHKMQNGDVLVANETTPDFVPAMSRACAIVTNVGGITSHAALVSREMRIPCIVGTKDATRIFKDGDLLEVDATNGMVRIVE